MTTSFLELSWMSEKETSCRVSRQITAAWRGSGYGWFVNTACWIGSLSSKPRLEWQAEHPQRNGSNLGSQELNGRWYLEQTGCRNEDVSCVAIDELGVLVLLQLLFPIHTPAKRPVRGRLLSTLKREGRCRESETGKVMSVTGPT